MSMRRDDSDRPVCQDDRFNLDLPPIVRMWGRDGVRQFRDDLDAMGLRDDKDQGDDQS